VCQQECVITFRYVSELAVEGDFVRVVLPITRLPIHGDAPTSTTSDRMDEYAHATPPFLPTPSFSRDV
jgi:hypothetical protein